MSLFRNKLISTALALLSFTLINRASAFELQDTNGVINIATTTYRLEITKKNFRYGFSRLDRTVIAPANDDFGLEFGGGHSTDASLQSSYNSGVLLDVVNDKGGHADVRIEILEHAVKFTVSQAETNRIVAHIGGISPAFGLADRGSFSRTNTDVTGISDDDFHAEASSGDGRLISDFVISPRSGFAMVNMEKGPKIVRVLDHETVEGTVATKEMPALYFFLGTPREMYRAFLKARNREGYLVYRPKYEFFGAGWEAFGALGWKSNAKTVTENVERYLNLGYPLEWMVVGSGFWPNDDPNLRATTSFGMWDKTRYPDPKKFIEHFKNRGLKFMLGLRIAFIADGPFGKEGAARGFTLKENGFAKAYKLGFPKSPAYVLDCTNPAAVHWYMGLVQKWLDYGVDGFKEDLFGYRVVGMRDGGIDKVNEALMDRGVFVMGRNGYLGSPMDLHRINDFNFGQNQDRGPINVLQFSYSGFPYAYPDIVGGTFGENRKMPPLNSPTMQNYMMRAAQFDAVNPSMAVGMGPWNFGSEQVERVMLAAAQLHGRLHPYIYSAAIDAYETGFPSVLTPLPLAFPDDTNVYGRENTTVRGYEWMFGPSLLATPLYGDDFATATNRDVYLPAGKWMDYDTGKIYTGPQMLKNFPLPVEKTPLFVGGSGVLIIREHADTPLTAVVYPITSKGSNYHFTDRDGATHTTILNDNDGWNVATLKIKDTMDDAPVRFRMDAKTGAVRFSFIGGHDYRLTGGAAPASTGQRAYRIMALGDSITEGGKTFTGYRYPLFEKLTQAGYKFEFVGSRTSASPAGPLAHEGYGGKSAEFLAAHIQKNFHEPPADIVLLHSGHNHDAAEHPVPKILAATESIIKTVRAENPHVIVLLAEVITSGKLPKYDYIPELNARLAALAEKLNTSAQPVILVNQAAGFDWHTDTIEDHVHPNTQGAEKMAAKWFNAITNVFGPAPDSASQLSTQRN